MRNFKKNFSKTAKRDFAIKMAEIEDFVKANGITQSYNGDSYYFTLNGTNYRVSNHSPESSPYHDGRDKNTVYIYASKTRIIDIYNDLKNGYILDGRGNRKGGRK
jgi:hypothetical protein